MNTEVVFSTGNNNWSTPQSFFDRLNSVFHFTLDPCADDTNHKCELYYTEQNDGLAKNWGGRQFFCNPLYSRRTKGKSGQEDWIENVVVRAERMALLLCGKYISKIRINGELKYIGTFNTPEEATKAYDNEAIENFGEFANLNFEQETKDYGIRDDAAPFPSEVVVFTDQDFDQQIRTLEDLGKWIKLKD